MPSWSRARGKKPFQKIFFVARDINFWKFGFAGNYYRRANFKSRFLIEYKRYIHLDTIHARNLKFGMYLPCVTFHKSGWWIFEILIFGHFMGEKLPKMAAILDFWQFFVHKMAKNQNFKNRSVRFVERHTRKVHAKFQVPSMYGVQMNVPFVLY